MKKPMEKPVKLPEKDESAAYHRLDRRELFSRWLPPAVAGVFLGGTGLALSDRPGRHEPPDVSQLAGPRDWRPATDAPQRLVVAKGQGPVQNLQHALKAIGGIESFVRKGERVAIKPNCAWDRTPAQAANTDPELIGELVRLCVAAGAASVCIFSTR